MDGRADQLRPALILALFALPALSCGAPAVAAMRDGTAVGLSGRSRVVFVRPSSPCDRADTARIVDLEGRFVGALGPGTWFQAPLDEEKVFAVWSSIDYRTAKQPDLHPVDVVRVAPISGGTTFVAVQLGTSQRRCGGAGYYFSRPREGESAEWMQKGRERVPDLAAGQALLDENPEVTRAHLEMAREKEPR